MLDGVHMCFTTSEFPSGVFMLLVSAYSNYTHLSLDEHERLSRPALADWDDVYRDMNIIDLSSTGRPPLQDRVRWATLRGASEIAI